MLKTFAKLTFGIAALAAATSFGTSPSRAFGDAPWCSVKNLKGEYWLRRSGASDVFTFASRQ